MIVILVAPVVLSVLYVSRLLESGSLDAVEAELAYVTVAVANECDYCVASHTERLVEHVGLPRDVIDAIVADETESFDDCARATVEFARASASDPKRVAERDLDALRAVGFDDADIVELVAVVAAAVAANVIADVLNVSSHDHGALDEYAP